ncbi:MAG: DUF5615 family PIN-like protein [Panacagrimonas sp.]
MKWLADENIAGYAIEFLRHAGHDVAAVKEIEPGLPDKGVLALARKQDRILLSFDRDHGDLIFNQGVPAPHAVVYLRLHPTSPESLATILTRVVALEEEALTGQFTVATEEGLRQRRLP